MIQSERVQPLNDLPPRNGSYVLYWMQASQRTRFNHALEYAIREANALKLPVVVGFGLTDDYPEANRRHYAFMLEGLRDVAAACRRRGLAFVIRRGSPEEVAVSLAEDAAMAVCDRGYLRHQKAWRERVARHAKCPVIQVESDVVVPVQVASDKQEFAARTIRPKITNHRERFLVPVRPVRVKVNGSRVRPRSNIDLSDVRRTLNSLRLDDGVAESSRFVGGEIEAGKRLARFLRERLAAYPEARREPAAGGGSFLSPYLHFGQVSPVEVALAVRGAEAPGAAKEALLEELIVRRELAVNFVHYQARYDEYACLPEWAQKTLRAHRRDARYRTYTRSQLEAAATHDPLWNAAQREMNLTGFMHNSMRMYWGKKILEWKRTPEEAFADALHLNNKYFIDGRDPAGYANVAWLFGLHDRPWGERKVFGTVRYMNAAGLERKFDMDAYVRMVDGFAAGHPVKRTSRSSAGQRQAAS